MKLRDPADRAKVIAMTPKDNESSFDHGMRCWRIGQRLPRRADWEAVKVDAMYEANKAKLSQHPEKLAGLIACALPLSHRGSSAFWDKWNCVLLTLLRAEFM